MKEGLFLEEGELVYYQEGHPYHAGVIKVDDAIYYINSRGRAVKGEYIVQGSMTNDIIKHGTYTFGDDYKLIEGSYIAPRKIKKKKRRFKKLIKEFKKKKVLGVVVAAVALFAMTGVTSICVNHLFSSGDKSDDAIATTDDKKIVLPKLQDEVLLCSSAAKQEYDGELTLEEAILTGTPYRAFIFEYKLKDESGILEISENADLTDAQEYTLDGNDTKLSIDNLKTGTTYYYKVTVEDAEYTGSFKTAASTRFVKIPGIVNTRDIGGYINQDGKTVKQGLLIRGVEIDGLVNAYYFIPNKEIEEVQNTFGFVYDFDLREPLYHGEYQSRLGTEIGHDFYNSPQYGQIFNTNFHPTLRKIFTDLADPAKYPMYLHCTWGADRTGTIVFLLQGILNMSEEDMIREYKLTGYVDVGIVERNNLEVLVSGFEPYKGETISEKIVLYLTTVVGVKESEIEAIRNIYLE